VEFAAPVPVVLSFAQIGFIQTANLRKAPPRNDRPHSNKSGHQPLPTAETFGFHTDLRRLDVLTLAKKFLFVSPIIVNQRRHKVGVAVAATQKPPSLGLAPTQYHGPVPVILTLTRFLSPRSARPHIEITAGCNKGPGFPSQPGVPDCVQGACSRRA